MTITDPAYTDAFADGSTGGLLAQVLSPWKGGGKFLLVVLAFSVVCVILDSPYSSHRPLLTSFLLYIQRQ